jgi:hypothetical protein
MRKVPVEGGEPGIVAGHIRVAREERTDIDARAEWMFAL